MNIRRATRDDAERLFQWRCDPVTAAMFLQPPPSHDQHVAWLTRTLGRDDMALWIGEHEDEAIGTVRLDGTGDEREISITIAPDHRGYGLATPLIAAALDTLPPDVTVIANIKPENEASCRAFTRAGFVRHGMHEDLLHFCRPGGRTPTS